MYVAVGWRLQARKNLVPRLSAAPTSRQGSAVRAAVQAAVQGVSSNYLTSFYMQRSPKSSSKWHFLFNGARLVAGVAAAGDSAAAGARPRLCVRVASAESKEFLRQIYYDSFMFDV